MGMKDFTFSCQALGTHVGIHPTSRPHFVKGFTGARANAPVLSQVGGAASFSPTLRR